MTAQTVFGGEHATAVFTPEHLAAVRALVDGLHVMLQLHGRCERLRTVVAPEPLFASFLRMFRAHVNHEVVARRRSYLAKVALARFLASVSPRVLLHVAWRGELAVAHRTLVMLVVHALHVISQVLLVTEPAQALCALNGWLGYRFICSSWVLRLGLDGAVDW